MLVPCLLLALVSPLAAHVGEQQKLLPSDGAAGDAFGRAVDLDGDLCLVGAPGATGTGAAYLFGFDGAEFHELAKLIAGDGAASDLFGSAVALTGDLAAIGAPGRDESGTDAGAVYVFARTGSTWSLEAKLLPGPGSTGALFGRAVALEEDTLIVGAPQDGITLPGAAQVFVRNAGAWSLEAVLSSGTSVPGQFGFSVALAGDTAVVGMPTGAGRASGTGAAFVFERGASGWGPGHKLSAPDGDALDFFGIGVAVAANALTVGASGDDDGGPAAGAVYHFTRSASGWTQASKRLGSAAGDLYGGAVAKGLRSTLVGARSADDEATNAGATYMYVSGVLLNVLVATDAAGGDMFGASVAAGDCWQAAGAWGNDELGANAGAVYVYVLVHPEVTLEVGSGVNPILMTTVEPPVIGHHWTIEVDASAYPTATYTQVLLYEQLAAPRITTFGEVLIDLASRQILISTALGAGVTTHEIPIPHDPFLLGFEAAAQGVIRSSGPGFSYLALTNAEHVRVGCPEVGGH